MAMENPIEAGAGGHAGAGAGAADKAVPNPLHKITPELVASADLGVLGDWTTGDFVAESTPFRHCIIHNFLSEEHYKKVKAELPAAPDSNWWVYNNPLEVKYALDKFDVMGPNTRAVFYALATKQVCERMQEAFGKEGLEYDPFCHGAGLHMHPQNGRLAMHLDYERHPIAKDKQRRLNIILYLNDDWKEEWNGDTQLWTKDMSACVKKVHPQRNTAVIFETTEQSWHGLPDLIKCPEGRYRRTLAFYYVSSLSAQASTSKVGSGSDGYRSKAVFVARPTDPKDPRLDELRAIRPNRRITEEDMARLMPEWDPSM